MPEISGVTENLSDKKKEVFLDISSLLTGFTRIELEATGMSDFYYITICEVCNAENLDYFLMKSQAILLDSCGDLETANASIALNLIPDGNYDAIAKRIILLWYTGMWFTDLSNLYNATSFLSADSYQQGLVWKIIGSHPPGGKQPGYGSWAYLPIDVQSH
jgi:hypothetical protein